MERINCNADVSLSRVTAGCMRIHDAGLTGQQLLRFVHECLDMGVDTFDHAPCYGAYTCESFFGENVLRKEPELRSKMKLVSKTGLVRCAPGMGQIYNDARKGSIIREVNASLVKLGTSHLDLLLIHRPDVLGDPAETASALNELVQSGKVLAVGVSNYAPLQTAALQRHLSVPLVVNQVECSVVHPDAFLNGTVDDAFLHDQKLMAWSPLCAGSLFYGIDAQSIRLRKTLDGIAERHGVAMDTLMYAWLFRHPIGMAVITGSMRTDRIARAVQGLDLTLSYEEWYAILAASRGYEMP